ncbi:MAG: radical SAM family heme chaperone HemW [Spirochaetaceae bacterium]|nr:MAG: radical SAM family heme chaperone HemW [Spirochaetaceae bacterium]
MNAFADGVLTPLEQISVYVHIPFCTTRCRYCDFYTETGRSARVIARTLQRIVEEADAFSAALGRPTVVTVYIGGGTPSVIPAAELEPFLGSLRTALRIEHPPAEWTFEANPETITADRLDALSRSGVDRLSIGIQTFDDTALELLGRRARADVIRRAIRLVSERWRGDVTVDLMTGLPGQTAAGVLRDVEEVVQMRPAHVSIYSLTVEERTPLARMVASGEITLPDADQRDALWFTADAALRRAGYDAYEVSNYARDGKIAVHNTRYWEMKPYLGLGPGGVGTLPIAASGDEPHGSRSGHGIVAVRLTNPNLARYTSTTAGERSSATELITAQTLFFEHFLTGLRTSRGVSIANLRSVFGIEPGVLIETLRNEWRAFPDLVQRGLTAESPFLAFTPRARLFLNSHISGLDDILQKVPLGRVTIT